ncbi:hypothetical protein F4820DRAFT_452451 [Hypoxylon rubiginosum]|uniref:Uncharacterized protein n=1 Tax=Hypoxylon rubiginosum TaxID=110542 RepID=A0ACB9YNN5_9PEZI|nr:hypothetical protein F4820DRAFT_452451 [Hypoxylon rubiginosum]
MLFKIISLAALAAAAHGMPAGQSYPTASPLTFTPLSESTNVTDATKVPGTTIVTSTYGEGLTTVSNDLTVPTSWRTTVTIYPGDTTVGWTSTSTSTSTPTGTQTTI